MNEIILFLFTDAIGIIVLLIFCRLVFNLHKISKKNKVDKCDCPGCLISEDPNSGYQPCHNLNIHIKPVNKWPIANAE